jgi:choline dehydrogenase-like flavoprotein
VQKHDPKPPPTELSGIGNPEILAAAGIDCVVNLPGVGENLQEHPMTTITYELTPGYDKDNITIDSLSSIQSYLENSSDFWSRIRREYWPAQQQ